MLYTARMQHRPLGQSVLRVSSIGLGCVTFRAGDRRAGVVRGDGPRDGRGINFFDTAEAYAERQSERIIGRWIKLAPGRREKVVLATKVLSDLSAAGVTRAAEDSLTAFATDRIDLFYLHKWPAPPAEGAVAVDLEATLIALDKLVREGKVRALATSNTAAWELCRGLWIQEMSKLARFDAVQPAYSLADRRIERELLPCCADRRVGVVTYSPLAAGFLTGKYKRGGAIPAGTRFDIKPGHQLIYFHDRCYEALDKLHAAGGADRAARGAPGAGLGDVAAGGGERADRGAHAGRMDQAFAAAEANLPAEILAELDALSAANV